MKEFADSHFAALTQVVPDAKRLMLFDYDDDATYHPEPNNPVLYEWKRKNIENYLLVPDAWVRAAYKQVDIDSGSLFAQPVSKIINTFFENENLTLPRGKKWKDVMANVFVIVDGKKILFEGNNSLFQILRKNEPSIELIKETIAINMTADEIHNDVYGFFDKLKQVVTDVKDN